MVVRNSKDARSESLMFFSTAKFAMLVVAFWAMLRGALPNGVPNTFCAIPLFTMKRTSFLVTATKGQGIEGLVSQPDPPTAVKLTNWVGLPVQSGSLPVNEKTVQASPANIPTLVPGALGLPRNGRAGSTPIKAAQKLMS